MSNRIGIDYGMGQSNVDRKTGIRFGVIPMNALNEWAWEGVESDYGEPHCPKCGNEAIDGDIPGASADDEDYTCSQGACGDYACESCRLFFDGEEAFGDEPIGHTLDDGEYKGTVGSDGDLFILSSPYYTHAQFCSPCAPGAGYLLSPTDKSGPKVYCLDKSWFPDNLAPYPVYSVKTGELISEGTSNEDTGNVDGQGR
jgi:hypothetical protein